MRGIKRTKSESNLTHFVKTGNRIIKGNYDKDTPDVILLYRGIKPHKGPYGQQTDEKHSVIGPKKPLNTELGTDAHIEGATDSAYTSWTPNYDMAKKFAGDDGIVMRGVFSKSDLVHPIINFEGEIEYSVIGTVVGAKRVTESPFKDMTPEEILEEKQKQYLQWLKESDKLNEKNKKENQSILNDPLKTQANSQNGRFPANPVRHEFTPEGKSVRTWEKGKLVSGVGVEEKINKNTRTRSHSELVPPKNQFIVESNKKPLPDPDSNVSFQTQTASIAKPEVPKKVNQGLALQDAKSIADQFLKKYFIVEKSKIKNHKKEILKLEKMIQKSKDVPSLERCIVGALLKQINDYQGFIIKRDPRNFINHLNQKENGHHYSRLLLLLLNKINPNNGLFEFYNLNLKNLKIPASYSQGDFDLVNVEKFFIKNK